MIDLFGLTLLDLLGFAGSGLIVLSLTTKSMLRLRVIGLMGATTFIVYGVWLGAWPVVATNCATFSINAFHLRRLLRASGQPNISPACPAPSARPAAGGTPVERAASPPATGEVQVVTTH